MARLCGCAGIITDTSCHSPTISLNSRGLQVLPETISELEHAEQRAAKVSMRSVRLVSLLPDGFAEWCRLRVVQAASGSNYEWFRLLENGIGGDASAVGGYRRGCGLEGSP
jgi:hypothetical protein